MKALKRLGFVVAAAMLVSAYFGASSASATVLCEVTPAAGTDCGAANHVATGTSLDLSLEAGTSTLGKGPFGETIFTCTESTIKGRTANTGSTAETVKVNVETVTFGSCNRPVTVKASGTFEIHHLAGTDNGTLTSTGFTYIVDETIFGTCQYATSATSIGTLTGKTASAPTYDINAKITSENGCPQLIWSGSYVYTGTTNFNVAAG